jgi:Predicted membrane protein
MGKDKFIKELVKSLQGEVPESIVKENIKYYEEYISAELAKGSKEKDILEEIGSPRLIAKTIIATSPDNYENSKVEAGYESERENLNFKFKNFNLNEWKIKAILFGILLIIIVLVVLIFKGAFYIIINYGWLLLLIWLLYKLIKRK